MACDRPIQAILLLFIVILLFGWIGCAFPAGRERALDYDPDEFRAVVRERVPELPDSMSSPPFEIGRKELALARKRVLAAARGAARIEELVAVLTDPKPEGLGLQYDWATSATASRTLELGRGNCVALASVLVGLGRGLGWPIFYAEARPRRPEMREFEEVTAVSDHMVVIVVARTVRMVVDFTGLVEEGYDIRPIDDLTAYAHLINNIAGHRLIDESRHATEEDWVRALEGFELATRIEPRLGRAWNNLGIAYTRLRRFDEARYAYGRALELDTAFGSPQRNLTLMETRAAGEPTLIESELPD
jgi:tetratricopeptide (TPR) repeat protein